MIPSPIGVIEANYYLNAREMIPHLEGGKVRWSLQKQTGAEFLQKFLDLTSALEAGTLGEIIAGDSDDIDDEISNLLFYFYMDRKEREVYEAFRARMEEKRKEATAQF